MSRVCYNRSFLLAQNQNMCHGIIDSNLVEIQSQLDQNSGIEIADGVRIKNRRFSYRFLQSDRNFPSKILNFNRLFLKLEPLIYN